MVRHASGSSNGPAIPVKGVHTAMHSRPKRIRNIFIGVAMAVGVGGGLAATLPANAADGDLGTWIMEVNVAPANSNMRSFQMDWIGSSGNRTSACYEISPGESQVYNQTGVLGEVMSVQGFAAAGCPEGDKLAPHPAAGFAQFKAPSEPETRVKVTFNLGSVQVQ
jgi:hypothetical protein